MSVIPFYILSKNLRGTANQANSFKTTVDSSLINYANSPRATALNFLSKSPRIEASFFL